MGRTRARFGPPSLPDARPGADPFVIGLHDLGQIIVGNHTGRVTLSGAGDSNGGSKTTVQGASGTKRSLSHEPAFRLMANPAQSAMLAALAIPPEPVQQRDQPVRIQIGR